VIRQQQPGGVLQWENAAGLFLLCSRMLIITTLPFELQYNFTSFFSHQYLDNDFPAKALMQFQLMV